MERGRKRYVLLPPDQCHHTALLKEGPSARHSYADWSNPDDFHLLKNARGLEVIIEPGDALYVPALWLHFITSLTLNIQCNSRSGTPPISIDELRKCGFTVPTSEDIGVYTVRDAKELGTRTADQKPLPQYYTTGFGFAYPSTPFVDVTQREDDAAQAASAAEHAIPQLIPGGYHELATTPDKAAAFTAAELLSAMWRTAVQRDAGGNAHARGKKDAPLKSLHDLPGGMRASIQQLAGRGGANVVVESGLRPLAWLALALGCGLAFFLGRMWLRMRAARSAVPRGLGGKR